MMGSSTPPRARYGNSPPFQHVEPPWIVGEMHADMVGHEIENKAEVVLLQGAAQSLEAGVAAEFRIDFGVIDDVIAVGAALARLHERRRIEVGDTQRFQIGRDGGSGVEIKIRGELQAVGCDRNGGTHYRASRRQNTDHGGTRPLVSPPQIGVPVFFP